MSGFVFTLAAEADLDEIWAFVAQDNPEAATRLLDQFQEAARRLAEHPNMGHLRPDLTGKPVRFWAVRSYLVVYRPDTRPLQILRILHGFRDVAAMLG